MGFKSIFIIFGLVQSLVSVQGLLFAQMGLAGEPTSRKPANQELVNRNLKETAFEQEYDSERARIEFQKSHSGVLQLESSARKEVFLNDNFQAAPTFSELNGTVDPTQTQSLSSGPVTEVQDQRFREWSNQKARKKYRDDINRQYHEYLRRSGLPDDKRDIASELERLEKEQSRQESSTN